MVSEGSLRAAGCKEARRDAGLGFAGRSLADMDDGVTADVLLTVEAGVPGAAGDDVSVLTRWGESAGPRAVSEGSLLPPSPPEYAAPPPTLLPARPPLPRSPPRAPRACRPSPRNAEPPSARPQSDARALRGSGASWGGREDREAMWEDQSSGTVSRGAGAAHLCMWDVNFVPCAGMERARTYQGRFGRSAVARARQSGVRSTAGNERCV